MSIFIRPFKISDLSAFVPLEPMGRDEFADPELAKAIEDSDLAVTGVRDGKVVGCGGAHPMPVDGLQGELWLRLSKECTKFPFDTLRWLKDGLKIIEETFPFKKLNAVVWCDFKKSIKLVKFLGFKQTKFFNYNSKKWLIFSKRVRD